MLQLLFMSLVLQRKAAPYAVPGAGSRRKTPLGTAALSVTSRCNTRESQLKT